MNLDIYFVFIEYICDVMFFLSTQQATRNNRKSTCEKMEWEFFEKKRLLLHTCELCFFKGEFDDLKRARSDGESSIKKK